VFNLNPKKCTLSLSLSDKCPKQHIFLLKAKTYFEALEKISDPKNLLKVLDQCVLMEWYGPLMLYQRYT